MLLVLTGRASPSRWECLRLQKPKVVDARLQFFSSIHCTLRGSTSCDLYCSLYALYSFKYCGHLSLCSFVSSRTPRLPHSRTPRLPDSQTPIRDSETLGLWTPGLPHPRTPGLRNSLTPSQSASSQTVQSVSPSTNW